MKKINLTIEMILNNKFPTEISGYNATEVDKYLDQIIADYKVFEEEIKILNQKIQEKNMLINQRDENLETLKLEISNLKIQLKESSKASQYEILKAINGLKNRNK